MAFPTTAILDNFTRADAATLGANWTDLVNGFAIVSNQAAPKVDLVDNVSIWNVATYGPDSECYFDVPTKTSNNNHATWLIIRATTLNIATIDGYAYAAITLSGTDSFRAYRMDNFVQTQLGASVAVELTSGDSQGLEMIGTTLAIYHKTAGTWSQLATRTDATYTAAGYIGIYSTRTSPRVDNFGGGTIGAAGVTIPLLSANMRGAFKNMSGRFVNG